MFREKTKDDDDDEKNLSRFILDLGVGRLLKTRLLIVSLTEFSQPIHTHSLSLTHTHTRTTRPHHTHNVCVCVRENCLENDQIISFQS